MIKLIVACGINGEIGGNNKLLWSLPKDLQLFKEKTLSDDLLIGRKTYESLPTYPKGLPERGLIVLTSQELEDIYCEDSNSDVVFFNTMTKTIRFLKHVNRWNDGYWIAGGKGIYEHFEHLADEIHITEVDESFPEADTFYKPDLSDYTEDVSQRVDVSSDTLKAVAKVYIKNKQ